MRKSKFLRKVAIFFAFLSVFQAFQPTIVFALTSGPSQPEVQSFEPVGTSKMVDLFTGDFTYNVPLFELPGPNGGYPFNLAYHGGIGMDQEATWVGLGWTLNPGAITRDVRGVPDDFDGEHIGVTQDMKPNKTVGVGLGASVEIFGLGLSQGISVFKNNYKGFGYAIDGNVGYTMASKSGGTAKIGLGYSMNSQEGISLQPSLSFSKQYKQINKRSYLGGNLGASIGVGYHSRQGLTSFTYGTSTSVAGLRATKKDEVEDFAGSSGTSSRLSFVSQGYTPEISLPMNNLSLSAKFSLGGSWWGIYGSGYVTGFYSIQKLKYRNELRKTASYGFMNIQNSKGNIHSVLDFNRESDGAVGENTPNLGIPSLTYDIYSVKGQGIGGMYKPMRNDLPVLRDQYMENSTVSASIGVDVGPAASHVGVNSSVVGTTDKSGYWEEGANVLNNTMNNKEKDSFYEPWYFKVHGEHNVTPASDYNKLLKDKAIRFGLTGPKRNREIANTLHYSGNTSGGSSSGDSKSTVLSTQKSENRVQRVQAIQSFTNKQIKDGELSSVLPILNFDYFNESGLLVPFSRGRVSFNGADVSDEDYKVNRDNQVGAIMATNPTGTRYVYGLPAHNLTKKEVSFSTSASNSTRVDLALNGDELDYKIANSEEYLNKKETPTFVHSHMLTAILGPDYVDVTGDGVSADDLGYWVKFTYQRVASTTNPYQWRMPFNGAIYNGGYKTNASDNKGFYTYGKKELWFLKQVETATHIAKFETEARKDAFGVSKELQTKSDALGSVAQKALTKIVLFARSAGQDDPIKTVDFTYSYDLCKKVDNGVMEGGKLTLETLTFNYGKSKRGTLNPYVFDYNKDNPEENPNYDLAEYDRWGNYKPLQNSNDSFSNSDAPYVDQNPENKDRLDLQAGVWSLKRIELPSGGEVNINYEIDDYGFVQHKQAMQMMELVDPNNPGAQTYTLPDNGRVYFKLETPIQQTLSASAQKTEIKKYLDLERGLIYFRNLTNLKNTQIAEEFVSGYAQLDKNSSSYGLVSEASGDTKYKYGYFTLVPESGYHPMSVRAWQHLRTNQNELVNSADNGNFNAGENDIEAQAREIKSMTSILPQIIQIFKGFNKYCRDKGYGRTIRLGKSWVRLKSPDKIKYGGGLRVKQITLKDNWAHDVEGIYGQYYEYTKEEAGEIISSGVASYEPTAGGDENALRYAKPYSNSYLLRSDENLFYEYPINESYYPGPSVGYSKVTVMSLASAARAKKPLVEVYPNGKYLFPHSDEADPVNSVLKFGTTGKAISEFYTAREFPVITDETAMDRSNYKLNIPMLFLGNISTHKLAASQGYSVVVNDMHGKQKKVSQYRQTESGAFESNPFAYTEYEYYAKEQVYDKTKVLALQNLMTQEGDWLLRMPQNGDNITDQYQVSQEQEFFADVRYFNSTSWEGGVNVNTDILYIPIVFGIILIPVPGVIPNVSRSESEVKTVVTNKVIFKTGIMTGLKKYLDGAYSEMENVKWDKLSGKPVLTKVKNEFGEPVYNYSIPAWTQYKGMGPAYLTNGTEVSIENPTLLANRATLYYVDLKAGISDKLFAGDEMILYSEDGAVFSKGIYIGKRNGKPVVYSKRVLDGNYTALIYRSGYRNHLGSDVGNISALRDPSIQLNGDSEITVGN